MVGITEKLYTFYMNARFKISKPANSAFPKNISSVWIVRDGKIGDLLLITPFPYLIKKKWPQCKITVISNSTYKSIWDHNPYVDRIIEIKRSFNLSNDHDDRELGRISEQARDEKVDLLFCFDHHRHIAYFCRWCQPRFSLGFDIRKLSDRFWSICIKQIDMYRSELLKRMAVSVGLDVSLWHQEINWTHSEETVAEQLFKPLPQPRIGLVPWTSETKKNWPLPLAAQFCKQIKREYQVVLMGGNADRADAEKLIRLVGESSHISNFVGMTSVLESAVMLKQMDLLICCDTGIAHLAATVGCPSIILYGPTAPEVWKPLSDQVMVVKGERCKGCSPKDQASGFAINNSCNYVCMTIQPDMILEMIDNCFEGNFLRSCQ